MLAPSVSMLVIFFLVCFVLPCALYAARKRHFVDLIDDALAEEQLRQAGYNFLVLKKFRSNVYALRPCSRCKDEVRLEARHQTSTNIWNIIEYSLAVYGQKSGRLVEVFQCDWTHERQQELARFVERYNFATLPETT